jgi:aminocarboxymuconate-semialdehyde decarboxylase
LTAVVEALGAMTTRPRRIDVHSHFFPADVSDLGARTGDNRWPSLAIGDDGGRIVRGSETFRVVAPTCWDVDRRVEAMDAAGVDVHVLSPVPVTLVYWAEAALAAEFCRGQNELLAAAVAHRPDRFEGFASVPLPYVDAAVVELERAVGELGLAGVEIGAQIAGRELDDVSLSPFFAAAEALDVPLFVHPLDGGSGAIRRSGAPYDFGLGMLTDTAMAATALVFGGVLDAHPRLRIALAHGCGTFPWALPRLARSASAPRGAPSHEAFLAQARRLWCDALVFEPEHLPVLLERFGPNHVVLGSDFPFYPPSWGGPLDMLDAAVERGLCTEHDSVAITGENGWRFLGRAPSTSFQEG